MSHHNGARYLSKQPVVPNTALRLFQRELSGHPPGTGVHSARAFSECVLPTHKVLQAEAPSLHIGRFTADGSALVCFSLQLNCLVLLDFLGPTPASAAAADAATPQLQQQQVGFNSFFKERWRLPLCSDPEQLCRDFCVSLRHGRFLLLASCTPQEGGQGPTAALAQAHADTQRTGQQRSTLQQQQQQQQLAAGQQALRGLPAGLATGVGAGGASAPSSDCCSMTTFHVVDVQRSIKVAQLQFPNDFFDLSGNACASVHGDIIALTSIRQQNIHLLQVNRDGTLTELQQLGSNCQADDLIPVELAAAAEHNWQLQKQQERQQQQYWMHQQARALLPPTLCPPAAVCAAAAAAAAAPGPQQQQRQQQQQGQQMLQQGQQQQRGVAAAPLDRDSDSEMEEREQQRAVRRRLNPPAASATTAAAAVAATNGLRQQQQQQGQQRSPPLLPPQQQQQAQGAAASAGQQAQQHWQLQQQQPVREGGAAAAAAATAAALLDPGGQLITGLRQRLLAFLYKAAASGSAYDVAPTPRDFQYNFLTLSQLVVERVRFLSRQQLLLKLWAPKTGPGMAVEAAAAVSAVHFFGVYDLQTTRFVGFWRGNSPILLSAILEQPSKLLAASEDLSPWERCCAAALYPAGYAIGLQQQQTQPLSQPQQQQQGSTNAASHSQQQQQQGSGNVGLLPQQQQQQPASTMPPASGAANATQPAAAAGHTSQVSRQQQHSRSRGIAAAAGSQQQPHASSSGHAQSSSTTSSRAAKERLKLLQKVVLMVLPGLQSLCPSPFLDPHLFSYDKEISPIIGLRISSAQPVRFQLARKYPGFHPSVQQKQLYSGPSTPPTGTAAAAPAAAAAAASASAAGAAGTGMPSAAAAAGVAASGAVGSSIASGHHQQQLQQQPSQHPSQQQPSQQQQQQQQQVHAGDMLQLDVAQPPTVMLGGEQVSRRQLHLLHPTDPFVLVVLQTPGQPACLNLYFRL